MITAVASDDWDREVSTTGRGFMTINDWRRLRGWAEVAWGDAPWMSIREQPAEADWPDSSTEDASG